MRIFKIKKRSGSYRTIYSPSTEENIALKKCLPVLMGIAREANQYGVQHGFHYNRSSVTNAKQHCGWRFTLSFDLADFFDSVTPDKLTDTKLGKIEDYTFCFPDGAARQGLCTSPALANIAAAPMDKEILEFVCNVINPNRVFESTRDIKRDCVYTRYADDMTFSFDSVLWFTRLKEAIPRIAEKYGFRINPKKTVMQSAAAGRRMITGVAVDKDLHIPRATKRRLRAAIHQHNTAEARGLKEWCKLRMPKKYKHIPRVAKTISNKQPVNNTKNKVVPGQGKLAPVLKRRIQLNDD
jgi:RNA-directed DNA polymerase